MTLQPGPNPWLRFVIPVLEHAPLGLDLCRLAPPGNERFRCFARATLPRGQSGMRPMADGPRGEVLGVSAEDIRGKDSRN